MHTFNVPFQMMLVTLLAHQLMLQISLLLAKMILNLTAGLISLRQIFYAQMMNFAPFWVFMLFKRIKVNVLIFCFQIS